MKSQSVKRGGRTQSEEKTRFRKAEKIVLSVLIFYFLVMSVLYALSLSEILRESELNAEKSMCQNYFHYAKVAAYVVILLFGLGVWTAFVFVLRRERHHVWLERRAVYLNLLISLVLSFALRILMQLELNIFDAFSKNDDTFKETQSPAQLCIAMQGLSSKQTLTTVCYTVADLGYIYAWLLFKKPHNQYQVFNSGRWDNFESVFQTSERDRCCWRKRPKKN